MAHSKDRTLPITDRMRDAGRAFVTGFHADGRPYKGGDLSEAVRLLEGLG